ncbi:predicted protein [Arabidopsis lyrata subsp. lyrata]|uniref:Predicted protein n=1 Tax=Arabidopsis lyrata subsp. lyrata TaxID=81972 RepID=D7KNN1_ARALL|nr:predicted protein [Arabidopsis lyrata subsp. lyrata]
MAYFHPYYLKFVPKTVEMGTNSLCGKRNRPNSRSGNRPFALHGKRTSRIHHGFHSNVKKPWTKQRSNGGWLWLHEVVDEEDEQLNKLKGEWGEEVHNEVKTDLEEMNEYNASGRYTNLELWNFKEGRKAILKEVFSFILDDIKTLKRKRT